MDLPLDVFPQLLHAILYRKGRCPIRCNPIVDESAPSLAERLERIKLTFDTDDDLDET